MLQSRPACRRPTVGPAFQTIPELVRGAGDRFGDVEAVADGPLRLTFAELADRVRVAAGAFASAGVGRGDRVAIRAPQAAVIGVPDERLGQVGAAFVMPCGAAGEAELLAWCRSRMAGYKAPRLVDFVSELPLNAAGKVDKPRLGWRESSG